MPIFCVCELGERVTHQFVMFNEELERCDWNTLPGKLQRMYLIFLSNIQQSVCIQCYAGIKCSRDTFKQVYSNNHILWRDFI